MLSDEHKKLAYFIREKLTKTQDLSIIPVRLGGKVRGCVVNKVPSTAEPGLMVYEPLALLLTSDDSDILAHLTIDTEPSPEVAY